MSRVLRCCLVVSTLAASLTLASPSPAAAASVIEVASFGTNPGNLRMFKYIPDGIAANAPLVVVQHGCTQSAAAIDSEMGWTKLADTWKVAVVFPQQQFANDSSLCFRWYDPNHHSRGMGEALSVKQMVDNVKANHSIDPARVFVTGFSAGGAFTNVMAAAYPDVFSAAASVAGVPYKCAESAAQISTCFGGIDRTPTEWGDKVRNAHPTYTGAKPEMSVWHGAVDATVPPMYLAEMMQQWTNYHAVDQTADVNGMFHGHDRKQYKDAGGATRVDSHSLEGIGHQFPIDPGAGATQCGTADASHVDVNTCGAYYIGQHWGIATVAAPLTATFANSAVNDGYVKAFSSGTSPEVGTLPGLAVGKGTDAKFNRAVMSFDSSSLPDAATVTRAWVVVQLDSYAGNPWADPVGNTLGIDVKTGCFGTCGVQTGDWAAAPTASAVAAIPAFFSGGKVSADFASTGRSAVNKTGVTELKLRFTAWQFYVNAITLKDGASARLVVEYV